MSSQESKLREIDRLLDEQKARGKEAELEEALAEGFANVEDYDEWLLKEETERCRIWDARMREMERNGIVPDWLQKERRNEALRDAQRWHFDPEKCDCEEHIDAMFCPRNLESGPNSTTGPLGELDEFERRRTWDAEIDVRGPSRRLEGSDVHRLWSINSQEEQHRDKMPFWAKGDPLIRYLTGDPAIPPLSPHGPTLDGTHQDQDLEMMEVADDNLSDREPLDAQPENSRKRRKGGKGEIKRSKNRSNPARLPVRHSERAPPMKRGGPKKTIGDAVSQWERWSLGEPRQTRSQKRKTFIALNANSQPEVIQTQPRRSQRIRGTV
ncbi:MAG: hypothetical protein Q9202_002009 [Teloschistes flavicans]